MEFSTEYTDVAIIIQLYDVFVVDDDDHKIKHIIMIGQDTDESKGFFFTNKPTMWTWWEDTVCFYYKLSVR